MREMLEGGPLDVLTGDYLAELTMLILGRDRPKDPSRGYARTFLAQMEECLGLALDRGVRIVVNAGGLNPAGLADALRALAARLGRRRRVAHVEGDDLLAARRGTRPRRAADRQRLPGRVRDRRVPAGRRRRRRHRPGHRRLAGRRAGDRALRLGPRRPDALAGAVVAGHVLECGAQATGGNLSSFDEHPLDRLLHPGFPLAELAADGSCVITKHPGTGGVVDRDTVTAQLLYEIGGPRYAGPDVVGPVRHHRAGRRRPRPGADLRRPRRAAATDDEGLPELARRAPQRGHVRAHR